MLVKDDFHVIEDYLMVKMPVEIDHHMSESIRKNADAHILNGGVRNIVFDFEKTLFMDSSGIGVIMGRYKKVSFMGGKVYATHVGERVRKILSVSGLNRIVEIMD